MVVENALGRSNFPNKHKGMSNHSDERSDTVVTGRVKRPKKEHYFSRLKPIFFRKIKLVPKERLELSRP